MTPSRLRAAVLGIGHFDEHGEPVLWTFVPAPGQPAPPLFAVDDEGNRLFAGWTAAELKSYYIAIRSQ